MHYYGFKLGLRVTRCGLITHYPLLAARPHDIQGLATLVEGYAGGILAADKGFIDTTWKVSCNPLNLRKQFAEGFFRAISINL